jgi:hypothetical protein
MFLPVLCHCCTTDWTTIRLGALGPKVTAVCADSRCHFVTQPAGDFAAKAPAW